MAKQFSQDQFFQFNESETIVCGVCLTEDLEQTESGELTGDEAVTMNMVHELHDVDVEPYQCDGCLYQNEAYENVDA